MLSRRQWKWLADHQNGVNNFFRIMLLLMLTTYIYNFINVFFWNNKIPIQHRLDVSLAKKFKCFDGEGSRFFIEDRPTSDPLERDDASTIFLEKYFTTSFGAEILERRPECLAAYISDTVGWPEPYAILVVDRQTRKTNLRITYLRDYLKR